MGNGDHDVVARLFAASARHAVRQERPVVVFVAGQPGSGKTRLADVIQAVLDRRGGAVRVGSDLYKTAHPRYAAFLEEDVRSAGGRVRADTRRWQAEIERCVREHRFDAVVESALEDVTAFRSAAAAYRRASYRIEVAALVVPAAVSQLSLVDRYMAQVSVSGVGRYVGWDTHDTCTQNLARTLALVEAEQLADRITLLGRGATALYANTLTGAGWQRPPAAQSVVAAGQARPWGAGETRRFTQHLSAVQLRLHDGRVPAVGRLAVQADVERAFAFSEPVRRIAQPRREPPGVDYHRLSAAEHRWTFDEIIVPTYLSSITAHEQPVVTYVLAQPGAGKWRATNLVQRALAGRGVTRLSGDTFKMLHPDYHQLLLDNPRRASAAIRTDYKAWMAEAEAYVRARGGDLLIEASPGSVEEFWRSAQPFAHAGYRIDLVVLAVRAPDSRQGTAHRYARATEEGMPARFTSQAGHDVCYRAVPEIVHNAQAHPAVGSLLVLDRDFQALVRNERTGDGRRAKPPTDADLALIDERRRPYTLAEAARFRSVHQRLIAALPQYRDELEDIAAQAHPLLPVQHPLRVLPRPRAAAAALPVLAARPTPLYSFVNAS